MNLGPNLPFWVSVQFLLRLYPGMPFYSRMTKNLAPVVSGTEGISEIDDYITLSIFGLLDTVCAVTSHEKTSLDTFLNTCFSKPPRSFQSTARGRDGWNKGMDLD